LNHEQIYDRTARLRDLLAEAEKTGSFGEEIAEMYATDGVYTTEYAGVLTVRADGVANIMATHYDRDMALGWEGWTFPYQGIFVGEENQAIARWMNRGPGERSEGGYFETPGVSIFTFNDDGKIADQLDMFDLAHQLHLCDELEAAGLLSLTLKENWVVPMKQKIIEMLSPP
jgi:hypothetical protein